jgi:hypothetical protein
MTDEEANEFAKFPGPLPELIKAVYGAGFEAGMDTAEKEACEQARLLGMSGSRELQLLTRVRELEAEVARLRHGG